MNITSLNRWQAAAIHLALSALIAATAFGLIIVLWYPSRTSTRWAARIC